jgi:hypothetical protein
VEGSGFGRFDEQRATAYGWDDGCSDFGEGKGITEMKVIATMVDVSSCMVLGVRASS